MKKTPRHVFYRSISEFRIICLLYVFALTAGKANGQESGLEVALVSEVDWRVLSPDRGALGPRAVSLMGRTYIAACFIDKSQPEKRNNVQR